MNFCPNCGTKVNAGDKFCSNCGFKLQKKSAEIKSEPVENNETFSINEDIPEHKESNEVIATLDTSEVHNEKDIEDPIKQELDTELFDLSDLIVSKMDLDQVYGNLATKFEKIIDLLDGKIPQHEYGELVFFTKKIFSKKHKATEHDISIVRSLKEKYNQPNLQESEIDSKVGDDESVVKKVVLQPQSTVKQNNKLKRQLTTLSRVLVGLFDLNINQSELSERYTEIINKLSGRLRENEIKQLKNEVLPLCDKMHSASERDIKFITELIDNYPSLYNRNHVESTSTKSELKDCLNLLSGQSSNAIADADNLTDLQKYMHIKRGTLEDDLLAAVKTLNNNHGKLIFLVGNVGDGKSYSIAQFKRQNPDLFSDADIHIYYDATESFDPQKTAMETLLDELARFSDDNLENNAENWIIAINMGVLINFIRNAREKGNFGTLIRYLESTGITEKTSNIKNIENEYFNLISFKNYPLFTIDELGTNSKFYDDLFNKITVKTMENPFYSAYQHDKDNNKMELTHHNFELFSNPNVRETLKFLLIKIQIESKVIISTRSLLELIHDILVPTEFKNVELSYRDSLPYLLFGGTSDSAIIKKINAFDPMNFQNEKVEKLITRIYNSHKNLDELAELFLDKENSADLDWLWRYTDQNDTPFEDKVALLLRVKYLLEKNDSIFSDDFYYQYLNLLSSLKVNGKKSVEVKNLYRSIQHFIYKWCGSPRDGYVFTFVNEEQKFGVAIPFELKFNNVYETNFNVTFTLRNSDNEQELDLLIDFDIFVLINRVENGYLLKDDDRHKFVNVATFVENIIKSRKSNEETLIGNIDTDTYYRLTNDGMGIDLKEIDK